MIKPVDKSGDHAPDSATVAGMAPPPDVEEPPTLEFRVTRLENDVHSISEILGEVRADQRTHERRLTRIEQRLDAHDGRFDAIDRRFDVIDRRFDVIDRRFDAADQRFDQLDAKFDVVIQLLRPEPS